MPTTCGGKAPCLGVLVTVDLYCCDCLVHSRSLPENSIDGVFADWPSATGFMQRKWDTDKGGRSQWIEYWAERAAADLRACKPGAHGVYWSLPRRSPWTGIALEDGGWEIRDCITHLFGQGMSKSGTLAPGAEFWFLVRKPFPGTLEANIERWGLGDLALDACRVERGAPVISKCPPASRGGKVYGNFAGKPDKAHDGSLPKNVVLSHCPECTPAGERMVKSGGSIAPGSIGTGRRDNHVTFGADGEAGRGEWQAYGEDGTETITAWNCLAGCDCGAGMLHPAGGPAPKCPACGWQMWWACPCASVDAMTGDRPATLTGRADPSQRHANPSGAQPASFLGQMTGGGSEVYADSGGGSRYYNTFPYYGKAPGGERHAGCEDMYWAEDSSLAFGFRRVTVAEWKALPSDKRAWGNAHVSVKRLGLAEHLCRLIMPPAERIARPRLLEPVFGSGSGVIAGHRVGWDITGSEICPEAVDIAKARLAYWTGIGAGLTPSVIKEKKPKRKREAEPNAMEQRVKPADPRQVAMFGGGN